MYAHNLHRYDDDEMYSFHHNLKGWLVVMGIVALLTVSILVLLALNITYTPSYY